MYVVIFNRDKNSSEWIVKGPFNSKESAGAYAKSNYKTMGQWIVHPMTKPTEETSTHHGRYWNS